jgi:hypothetical protein
MAFRGPEPQRRWTVLIRLILVIPQVVVLVVLGIAAVVLLILGWFGALFTGRLPDFAEEFLSGYLRWDMRVYAYIGLLTDVYPPFTLGEAPEYPVVLAIPPPTELNRAAVFFRIILSIPAYIVAQVISGAATSLLLFVAWIVVLVTGQLPQAFFDIIRLIVRYHARLGGYFAMLTPEYPWGVLGDSEPVTYPGWELLPVPAARTTLIVLIVLNVISGGFTNALTGRNNNNNTASPASRSVVVVAAHPAPSRR